MRQGKDNMREGKDNMRSDKDNMRQGKDKDNMRQGKDKDNMRQGKDKDNMRQGKLVQQNEAKRLGCRIQKTEQRSIEESRAGQSNLSLQFLRNFREGIRRLPGATSSTPAATYRPSLHATYKAM